MKKMTVLLCLLLYSSQVIAGSTACPAVISEGKMTQSAAQEQVRLKARRQVVRYYIPFFLGIAGIVSATPVGMGLGIYLLFMASEEDYEQRG